MHAGKEEAHTLLGFDVEAAEYHTCRLADLGFELLADGVGNSALFWRIADYDDGRSTGKATNIVSSRIQMPCSTSLSRLAGEDTERARHLATPVIDQLREIGGADVKEFVCRHPRRN